MTESGNHGGSSYEETDSLALFIGLKNGVSDYLSSTHNIVYQVIIELYCYSILELFKLSFLDCIEVNRIYLAGLEKYTSSIRPMYFCRSKINFLTL